MKFDESHCRMPCIGSYTITVSARIFTSPAEEEQAVFTKVIHQQDFDLLQFMSLIHRTYDHQDACTLSARPCNPYQMPLTRADWEPHE